MPDKIRFENAVISQHRKDNLYLTCRSYSIMRT